MAAREGGDAEFNEEEIPRPLCWPGVLTNVGEGESDNRSMSWILCEWISLVDWISCPASARAPPTTTTNVHKERNIIEVVCNEWSNNSTRWSTVEEDKKQLEGMIGIGYTTRQATATACYHPPQCSDGWRVSDTQVNNNERFLNSAQGAVVSEWTEKL